MSSLIWTPPVWASDASFWYEKRMQSYIRPVCRVMALRGPDEFREGSPHLPRTRSPCASQVCFLTVRPFHHHEIVTRSIVGCSSSWFGHRWDRRNRPQSASNVRPCANSAQIVRAILFANATTTTLLGRRFSNSIEPRSSVRSRATLTAATPSGRHGSAACADRYHRVC